jgi:aryl-alcohol dehydrogenase-like predicted oxidoreductase
MFSGHATAAGTARFRSRFPLLTEAGHFRQPERVLHVSHLWLSSIGIGTYLGEPDAATDERYAEAVSTALSLGVNVVDSAINYRFQRSERSIGAALKKAIESGSLQRDELVVCSKAGYLTYDGTVPADPRHYFIDEYISTGIVPREELVGGMHCMAPGYLKNQLERSRRNLGVDTIDVFYIHNPEQQLAEISREEFHKRMRQAFQALEAEVDGGRIRVYGTATWNGYRQDPTSREYLDLAEISAIASDVGGENHHFRAIQLPFNLGLPEAHTTANQRIGSQKVSLLTAAQELGIAVIASASLLQGRLTSQLPEFVREQLNCKTDSEAAIQFARSAPGITSALIGMSRKEHVEANLKIATRPLAKTQIWEGLFARNES